MYAILFTVILFSAIVLIVYGMYQTRKMAQLEEEAADIIEELVCEDTSNWKLLALVEDEVLDSYGWWERFFNWKAQTVGEMYPHLQAVVELSLDDYVHKNLAVTP